MRTNNNEKMLNGYEIINLTLSKNCETTCDKMRQNFNLNNTLWNYIFIQVTCDKNATSLKNNSFNSSKG